MIDRDMHVLVGPSHTFYGQKFLSVICISVDVAVIYIDLFVIYYFYYFFLLVITSILDIFIIFLTTLNIIFSNIDYIIAFASYLLSNHSTSLSLSLTILLLSYYYFMTSLNSDDYR